MNEPSLTHIPVSLKTKHPPPASPGELLWHIIHHPLHQGASASQSCSTKHVHPRLTASPASMRARSESHSGGNYRDNYLVEILKCIYRNLKHINHPKTTRIRETSSCQSGQSEGSGLTRASVPPPHPLRFYQTSVLNKTQSGEHEGTNPSRYTEELTVPS